MSAGYGAPALAGIMGRGLQPTNCMTVFPAISRYSQMKEEIQMSKYLLIESKDPFDIARIARTF